MRLLSQTPLHRILHEVQFEVPQVPCLVGERRNRRETGSRSEVQDGNDVL